MVVTRKRLMELATAALVGWFMSYLFHLVATPTFNVKYRFDDGKERNPGDKSEGLTPGRQKDIFVTLMEERQLERRQVMKGYCGQVNHWNSCHVLNLTNPDNLFNHKFKYTVCRVQKVASSNWIRAVLLMDGFYSFEQYHQNRVWGSEVITTGLKERTLKNVQNQMEKDEIWKNSVNIIMVRHPFLRLASAFNDKMGRKQPSEHYRAIAVKIEREYRQFRQDPDVRNLTLTGFPTFEDFANSITDPRFKHYDDQHWATYDSKCRPCQYHYDVIVKLETVEDDMRHLRTMLNVTPPYDEVFLGRKWINNYDVYELYRKLPKELLDKLYRKYEADFRMFGYGWPDWLDCPT